MDIQNENDCHVLNFGNKILITSTNNCCINLKVLGGKLHAYSCIIILHEAMLQVFKNFSDLSFDMRKINPNTRQLRVHKLRFTNWLR